uniref:Translocase of outer mitochondrial membrane 20 n=1 Tax=Neogobius melanostomus TaxID=47308 RepID=A0A8C6SYY6_9GOBI
MQTLEEPPYLTVGTDVSAKYRGAFCEAKIKTAKRLVKAKVSHSSASPTLSKCCLVGLVVEVKNQDGVYQEATINKLTDASIYTVVFDDGDEKTLRRSSLCLKGARHFAESETLDRLPLTNPEHFGTPVIGKKGNRGRRSNPIQEEELSSSSSEEEDSDQRPNEDLFGKVVCVEGVATGDKRRTTWYPALVISPDCHDDVTLKKDNVFNIPELNVPLCLLSALDAALEFLLQLVVPSGWKTEVKEESSSSEEDGDDEEEEQEQDANGEEEEEEVEPFPEERDNFLQQLYKFMEDRGTPINKRPVLGYRNLNLFKLYRLVQKLGGFDNIESGAVWKQVYQDLGIPILNSAAGYNVKCAYRKYVLCGFFTFSVESEPSKTVSKENNGEEGDSSRNGEADEGSSTGRLGPENLKEDPDEEQDGKDNSGYDEWVKADKILRPANKNVTKIKHRRKIKNKGERDRDRLDRLNKEREGLVSNRGPRSKCLSQDVFSKMDDGEDKVNQQSPGKSIEITSILNGLQASEMSTDESEREDEEPEHTEEERPGEAERSSQIPVPHQSGGSPEHLLKPPKLLHRSPRTLWGWRAPTLTSKGHTKAKTQSTRSADWLPGTSPWKPDRPVPGEDSSSSEDERTADTKPGSSERGRPKTKGAPSKKYNGMKEKNKAARQSGFWEIPEKRTKTSPSSEERPTVRSKGQKDVWSSIQAQWPKKTLKELFSDSDTEAGGPEDEVSEEQMDMDKQECLSSGSNSVLNTPPSTPETPSGGGSPVEDSGPAQPPRLAPSHPLPCPRSLPLLHCPLLVVRRRPWAAVSRTAALWRWRVWDFDKWSVFFSSAANSSDSEDQCVSEANAKPTASKTPTSDVKTLVSPKCPGRSPPSSHKYHKQSDTDHSHHQREHHHHHHGRSPRVYKWSFQMSEMEKMSSLERISFLQEKLQDIRNHYLSLKSEVASIDRRRKRMKKKERESAVAASSSSSSSSSPSSSSLTAAVMLTLAEPPVSSSSSQTSGVSVECR